MKSVKLSPENPTPSHYFPIEKQIEILKAFVVYYGENNTGTTYNEISKILVYDKSYVSSSLKFWKEIGLLSQDKAAYAPTQPLLDFNQKIQWGEEEEAWKIFRVAISGSWFVDQIKMKFQLKSILTRDELMKFLGIGSGAVSGDKNKQKSISILINLLEISKVILKGDDGNYTVNSDIGKSNNTVNVDESKEMLQVKIGEEVYAIDSDKIKTFVLSNGRKIDTSIQQM